MGSNDLNISDILSLISHFSSVTSWIGLAGLALFVMLILFRPVIKQLLNNKQVGPHLTHWLVIVFVVVVGLLVAYVITLAFLDGIRSIKKEQKNEVKAAREQCIDEEANRIASTRQFSVPGSVRCSGGGCIPFDGNCNRRQMWVSYSAPGNYYLDQISVQRGGMNHGSIGNYEITQSDSLNRALTVRVSVVCDPPDYPGAAGGWSNATLVGTERLRDLEDKLREINSKCESKFPLPE